MWYRWRNAALVAAILVTFASVWAAIAFEWLTETGIYLAAGAIVILVVILAVLASIRRSKPSQIRTPEPEARDEYGDLLLGRTTPRFPSRDVDASSQIDDANLPPS